MLDVERTEPMPSAFFHHGIYVLTAGRGMTHDFNCFWLLAFFGGDRCVLFSPTRYFWRPICGKKKKKTISTTIFPDQFTPTYKYAR